MAARRSVSGGRERGPHARRGTGDPAGITGDNGATGPPGTAGAAGGQGTGGSAHTAGTGAAARDDEEEETEGKGGAADGEDTAYLFRRACAGDQVAWDRLVSRYTALLWRIARAHHLSPPDASDVVQTTWLRLVEHADRITDPERLGGWLATTARRECLRVLRRSSRERPHPDDHDAFEEAESTASPPDTGLLRREQDVQLWSAMATLPERSRVLLEVLMAEPPPSYEDIAAALDMPRGSIGPTRARSLARLRELLDGDV